MEELSPEKEILLEESVKKWHERSNLMTALFYIFLLICVILLLQRHFVSFAVFGLFTFCLFIGLGHCVQKEQDFKNELSRLRAEMRAQFEREQRAKGLVNFIDRLGRERWGTPERVREWKIIDMDMRNNFARLSPREFEKLIANLFFQMGYKTQLTPKTADYGADVVAKKGADTFVIQVKRYSYAHKVGNRDIQRLLGSMWKYNANKAIFVTSSDFTDFAYKQAVGAPIELWNHRKLCEMIEKYILSLEASS